MSFYASTLNVSDTGEKNFLKSDDQIKSNYWILNRNRRHGTVNFRSRDTLSRLEYEKEVVYFFLSSAIFEEYKQATFYLKKSSFVFKFLKIQKLVNNLYNVCQKSFLHLQPNF